MLWCARDWGKRNRVAGQGGQKIHSTARGSQGAGDGGLQVHERMHVTMYVGWRQQERRQVPNLHDITLAAQVLRASTLPAAALLGHMTSAAWYPVLLFGIHYFPELRLGGPLWYPGTWMVHCD